MTNATFNVMFDWGGSNGSPGTSTAVDALGPPCLKFKNADDATIDTNDKITIPSGAAVCSFCKAIYLKCTANASSHTINNVKLYSDGANGLGTGVDLRVGLQFPTKNSGASTGYKVATATEMTAGVYTGVVTSTATIFDYNSGSALSVSISETSSVIDAANETTNYVILQLTGRKHYNPRRDTDRNIDILI